MAGSAALVAVPVVALALVGAAGADRFSATAVSTASPTTTNTVVEIREAVPEPRTLDAPKGVAVVAPPTTTTTAPPAPPAPPATTPAQEEAPAPESAPVPVEVPEPAPVRVQAVPAPTPAPAPRPTPAPAGSVSANLDAIAQCESGGNPNAYNPAGYYGAFQFSLATWHGLGLTGDPRDYTYAQQKFGALALYNRSGYSPWPSCARQLGLL